MHNHHEEPISYVDEIRPDLLQVFEKVYGDNNLAISKSKYMDLYTRMFNLVNPFTRPDIKIERACQTYELIEEHVGLHVTQIFKQSFEDCANDETILTLYNEQWTKFKKASKFFGAVCSFLDSNYCRKGSFRVYTRALVQWKEHLFCHLQKQITENILKLLEKERQGGEIDTGLVRDIINSYVELGINDERVDEYCLTSRIEGLSVYRDSFENAFLEDTERFYNRKDNDSRSQTAAELMDRIEQIVAEEHNRAKHYLHESTVPKLKATCERVFVEKHLDVFVNEFENLLANDSVKQEELGRIYRLVFSNSSKGLSKLRELFEEHVTQEILSVISIREEEADVTNDESKVLGTRTLAAVRNKYRDLIASTFNNDARFLAPLDDSFVMKIFDSTTCADVTKEAANESSSVPLAETIL